MSICAEHAGLAGAEGVGTEALRDGASLPDPALSLSSQFPWRRDFLVHLVQAGRHSFITSPVAEQTNAHLSSCFDHQAVGFLREASVSFFFVSLLPNTCLA